MLGAMTGESVVWRRAWSDDAGVVLTLPGDDVRFEEHATFRGEVRRGSVRFPYAALGRLLSTVDGPPVDALIAAVSAGIDRIGGGSWRASSTLRTMLDGAGVPYETDRRHFSLLRPAHPVTGHTGRIAVRFGPPGYRFFGVSVEEWYHRPEDEFGRHSFYVSGEHAALGRVPSGRGSADDLCPGAGRILDEREVAFVHAVRDLLGDGYGPAPGEVRDIVERWFVEAGSRTDFNRADRDYTAVRARVPGTDVTVFLRLRVGTRPLWSRVAFIETHRPGDDADGHLTYRVETPNGVIGTLTAGLTGLPGLSAPEHPQDRLFAYVKHLADTGVIGAHRPRGSSAAAVAERFTAAGVPATVTRSERRVGIRHVYRDNTDCVFDLSVRFHPTAYKDRGIVFVESWEYMPRPGDSGRDYYYSVATPYRYLRGLATFLAARTGVTMTPADATDEEVEEVVAAALRAVAVRDDLPIKANRDQVQALFAEAGVPVSPDSGAWINSD